MLTLFDTASRPVYVLPPSENARMSNAATTSGPTACDMPRAIADGARHDGGQMIAVHRYAVHDEAEMQHHEAKEDRQQHHDRFARAAKVEARHQDDEDEFRGELER